MATIASLNISVGMNAGQFFGEVPKVKNSLIDLQQSVIVGSFAPALAEIPKRLNDIPPPAKKARADLQEVADALEDLRGAALGMSGPFGGVISNLLAIGSAGFALQQFGEFESASFRLEKILVNTSHAAGVTTAEIQELAGSLEKTTQFSDNATISAAAYLAQFQSIKGDTFKETLTTAQDLAVALEQDLADAALALGKAMDDPVRGLEALRKKGFHIDPTLRDLAKSLQETGHKAEASAVILRMVQGVVGGLAVTAGNTGAGSLAKLQNAFASLGKEIGQSLRPMVDLLTRGLQLLADWGKTIANVVVFATAFIGTLKLLIAAKKAYAKAVAIAKALEGPKGWAQLAVSAAVAAGAVYALNKSFSELDVTMADNTGQLGALKDGLAEIAHGAEQAAETQKKLEDAQRATSDLLANWRFDSDTLGMTDLEKDIYRVIDGLKAAGETAEEIAMTQELLTRRGDEMAALERQQEIEEEIARLRKDRDEFGLSSAEKMLLKLQEMQASSEQIKEAMDLARDLEGLEAQKKAIEEQERAFSRMQDDAKKLAESLRTPFEVMEDEFARISELFSEGLIDEATFARATDQLMADFLANTKQAGNQQKGTGAMVRGSSAAFSAEQAAIRQNNPLAQVPRKLDQQIRLAEQMRDAMREQVDHARQMKVAGL